MAKKKVKKAPKVSKDININIRNIMSQIQNQPKRDYIKPQKKIPQDSFNTGQMYRAFAPAVTYASTPLQAFRGIAPIVNPTATRQLTSMPAVYRPDPIMVETNAYDIAPKPQPAPIESPRPVVPQQYRPGDLAAVRQTLGDKEEKQTAAFPRPLTMPGSALINQPHTKPLTVLEMMGASTPPYNPPMSASSIQSLTLPATAASTGPQQVSKPINQPNTIPMSDLAMMGVSPSSIRYVQKLQESQKATPNMEMIAARFKELNPPQEESAKSIAKRQSLLERGKIIQVSPPGQVPAKYTFPKKIGQ